MEVLRTIAVFARTQGALDMNRAIKNFKEMIALSAIGSKVGLPSHIPLSEEGKELAEVVTQPNSLTDPIEMFLKEKAATAGQIDLLFDQLIDRSSLEKMFADA